MRCDLERLYLFRLKAVEEAQTSIFPAPDARGQFFSLLILGRPSSEVRSGFVWHVGNVEQTAGGLCFAVGRTTKGSKELYDEESGDFVEVEDEESPFTLVVYDEKYGVLGIAPKSKLAPTARAIARNLERLLNAEPMVREWNVRVEIPEIWDPEEFLHQVQTAYAVTSFTVTFSGPNPFDVEGEFHKPLERYLQAADAEEGKASVKGKQLNREVVERVTRSVASTGNDASARLRRRRSQRPVTKHLKGDPATVESEKGDTLADLLGKLRAAYERIRKAND
jgi:hypothetical protein